MDPYIPSFYPNAKWDKDNSLNRQDLKLLKKWGMNLVRLGVIWEAVETAPGVYNQTYLNEIEKLINNLGTQGIYTMIDSHQDVMSRYACGEGIPDFFAKEVIKNAQCQGDWNSKEFYWLKKVFGTCRSIDTYNYAKDE